MADGKTKPASGKTKPASGKTKPASGKTKPAAGKSKSPAVGAAPAARKTKPADNKTKATGASVEEYIASRADERQRVDCAVLMAMLGRLTRETPKMWGPSIVGYGSCRYTYDSGRTGEMPLAAFAIRGRELVVYLSVEVAGDKSRFSGLGKHRIGKCCLYFKTLADLDVEVLERLVADSIPESSRPRGL